MKTAHKIRLALVMLITILIVMEVLIIVASKPGEIAANTAFLVCGCVFGYFIIGARR